MKQGTLLAFMRISGSILMIPGGGFGGAFIFLPADRREE